MADLIIAAEIGQQLVDANAALSAEYEEILSRTQQQEHQQSKGSNSSSESSATTNAATPNSTSIDLEQKDTPPTSPPSSSPARSAVAASKRASMSLSMSRLAMTELEKAEGKESFVSNGGDDADSEDFKKVKRKSSSGIYDYVTSLERSNAGMYHELNLASLYNVIKRTKLVLLMMV
jgi:hypothetical protein